MQILKTQTRSAIASTLSDIVKEKGLQGTEIKPEDIIVEVPPRPELGDLAIPMFPFAKTLRMAPQALATRVVAILTGRATEEPWLRKAEAAGPYVNVWIEVSSLAGDAIERVLTEGVSF
ncbi:MAG TPA: hypothetical protein PLG43_11465, partial [Spirochaetia bacterium]|nr:hypothetical protein [Spirochaetia bacterium]